ncbi:VOC family protein [Nocardioides marmoraquaticus]
MTCFVSHTSIDCADAYALSEWWKGVLGYVDDPDDPNEPGHDECWIQRPDGGHALLFIEVPEAKDPGKQVKNRIHLDLCPSEDTRDVEVERLLGHGAQPVQDLRIDDGRGWMTLADPEGNEFCVLRGPADAAGDQASAAT